MMVLTSKREFLAGPTTEIENIVVPRPSFISPLKLVRGEHVESIMVAQLVCTFYDAPEFPDRTLPTRPDSITH
jgi:hypothetical protein